MPLAALEFDKGQLVPVEQVLDAARNGEVRGPWTYELLSALLATVQDRGDRISTTTLTTKCDRSEYIKRTEPYTEKAANLWASFRGTMFHGQLEHHAHPDSIAEARYYVELEGLGTLSGSPDLVDPTKGVLYDYKFTKEVPRFDYAWDTHVQQVQVNRWLVDHATEVEWRGQLHDLTDPKVRKQFVPPFWDSLVVVYMDDKGPKPITVTRSEEVIGTTTGKPKRIRVPDIWPDEQVEEFIYERFSAWKDAFDHRVLPDIPESFAGWQHPLCGYCPVKDKCIDKFIEQQLTERTKES